MAYLGDLGHHVLDRERVIPPPASPLGSNVRGIGLREYRGERDASYHLVIVSREGDNRGK